MIIRNPYSIDRFFEVIATMPNPVGHSFTTKDPEEGITLELVAQNQKGICQYRFKLYEPSSYNQILNRFEGALNEYQHN